ncbi:MAG: amidohydrolase [Phycisphaerales bacterium]|nr:amidohydrolase [Phycisphaerales bacterium]
MPPKTTHPTTRLAESITQILGELISIRHDLHAHPQLMFNETHANRVVCDQLAALGIEHQTNMGGIEPNTGTGVLSHLPATVENPGPCIGLRADMDALPILEATGKEYCSTNEGIMHACGHDGHTTILLGAAKVLAMMDHRPNPVSFVFQPGEEGGAGAEKMIRDGALDGSCLGPKVDRMYGLHGWPEYELNQIGTMPGPMLAATDTFTVVITGKQGHAAYPHLCVDPVVAAAQIISAAQTIASRDAMPTDAVVVTFASIHAGSAFNVIPEIVELKGTVRTLRDETRAMAKSRFYAIVEGMAGSMGCSAAIDWHTGYPVTSNDEREARRVLEIGEQATFARRTVVVEAPTLGGEDFSYYGRQVASCFFFLGLSNPDQEEGPGLHTDRFDFNDDAIGLGVEMMCRLALS